MNIYKLLIINMFLFLPYVSYSASLSMCFTTSDFPKELEPTYGNHKIKCSVSDTMAAKLIIKCDEKNCGVYLAGFTDGPVIDSFSRDSIKTSINLSQYYHSSVAGYIDDLALELKRNDEIIAKFKSRAGDMGLIDIKRLEDCFLGLKFGYKNKIVFNHFKTNEYSYGDTFGCF